MNELENFDYSLESENEKNNFHSRDKSEFKLPCDMKSFWKSIDEKFFTFKEFSDAYEINHKIHSLSKYDINNDSVFTKIGFPKNLNQLIGKAHDLFLRKNNPSQIDKLFGMQLYIDKFDYQLNSLTNDEIHEEIDLLEEKLGEMEENNLKFTKFFKDIIDRENELTSNDFSRINLKDPTVKLVRLQNIKIQIFSLQLKQFSESVMNIKKCLKKDNYVLIFDPSEKIEPIVLEELDYRNFIRLRDTLNSTSIYDLFQEKIHSYYKVSANEKNKGKRKYKQKSKLMKKNIKNKRVKNIKKQKRHRRSKINDDEAQITNNIALNYNICHHCKQRKPLEVLTKCKTNDCGKVESPSKHYVINNTTVFRKNKNFIITNYMGDPREILENYLVKKSQYSCDKYFCNLCLKGSYDWNLDVVKDKKDWMCPSCLGNCFCSRCLRYDQMLKLIALYISLDGDMNELYEYMIKKSFILERLSKNLLISKVIIIRNESNIKVHKTLKDNVNINKSESDVLEKTINNTKKYIENLLGIREYFNAQLKNINLEKIITRQTLNLANIKIHQISNLNENYPKTFIEREGLKNTSPSKSRGFIIDNNNKLQNTEEKGKLGSTMNSLKLGSNLNNINIFTNKNINLNTNNKPNINDNNFFEKSNSEKAVKNSNIIGGDNIYDKSNQKLNFNFNFNFPTDECNKFLNRKRHANDDKKNKNFNVNLNLNVNLNTSDNSLNNAFNSEPYNRYNNNDTLRSLRENKSYSNQAPNIKNNLTGENNINFSAIQDQINPLTKKLKFINLKTRSSNDLSNENFTKKYLGDKVSENDLLQKKTSFDFEKYSNNFQNQLSKRLNGSSIPGEKRKNNKLNQAKQDFKFNFDILNISGINNKNSIEASIPSEESTKFHGKNSEPIKLTKKRKINKLNMRYGKKINPKYSRILRNLDEY